MLKRVFLSFLAGLCIYCSQLRAEEKAEETTTDIIQQPLRRETIYTRYSEELKNKEEREKMGGIEAINILSLYQGPRDISPKEDSFMRLYFKNLSDELNNDPFYYSMREDEKVDFPYEEKFWNAFGDTLAMKYKFARDVDRTLKKVQKAITLEYQTSSQARFRIRPGIERIKEQSLNLRLIIDKLPYINEIIGKIEKDKFTADIGMFLPRLKSKVYIEANHNWDESENALSIRLEKKFW